MTPRYQGSQLTGCSVGATHRIDGRTEWVLRALRRSQQPLEGNTRHGTKDNVHRRKGKSARSPRPERLGRS